MSSRLAGKLTAFRPHPRRVSIALALLPLVFICGLQAQSNSAAPSTATPPLPPLEAWAALPQIAAAKLSADGKRIAVLRNHADGLSSVVVMKVADGTVLRSVQTRTYTGFERRDRIVDITWADENHVGYRVDANIPLDQARYRDASILPWEAFTYQRMMVLDLRTGQSERVHMGGAVDRWLDVGLLIAPIAVDPGFGRSFLPSRSAPGIGVYRINLDTGGAGELLHRGNEDTLFFGTRADGTQGTRIDLDPVTDRWSLHRLQSGKNNTGKKPLLALEGKAFRNTLSAYLPDGRIVVAGRIDFTDRAQVHAFAAEATDATSEVGDLLLADPTLDLDRFTVDHWHHAVVGVVPSADPWHVRWLDAELERIHGEARKLLGTERVWLRSWAQDRSKVILEAEGPDAAGAFYLLDRTGNRVSLVGSHYPALNSPRLTGERRLTHYPARDGTRIPAVITLPSGQGDGPYPLVVMLTGYGRTVVGDSFSWLPAYFAARGFVVLEPHIHGTRGHGAAWELAADGQWLHAGVNQLEDAARALMKAGIASPAKTCGVGLQEGGALVALAATRPNTPFTCTVTVNAPLDLPAYLDNMKRHWWKYNRFRRDIENRLGDDASSQRRLRAVSPVHLASQIKGPMLVVGGLTTPEVTEDHAPWMHKALQAAGKHSTLVELNTGDFFLNEPSARLRLLQGLEVFLSQLPDAP
jgi:hypothetical protein